LIFAGLIARASAGIAVQACFSAEYCCKLGIGQDGVVN